jgi:hypothetical protein
MRSLELRRFLSDHGPATWDEICAEMDWSEQRAMQEVSALEYEPDRPIIEYRHVTFVHYNPTDRFCAQPGCHERLRKTNGTGYCSCHVQKAALSRWWDMTEEQRREIAGDITGEPDAAMCLWETQTSFEDVMTG